MMQNILLSLCEVCSLNGESGVLSGSSASSLTFSSFFCGSAQSIDVNCFKLSNPYTSGLEKAGNFFSFLLNRFHLRS